MRMPIMAITTSSSSKVKAGRRRTSLTAVSGMGIRVLLTSGVLGDVLAPRAPGRKVVDEFLEVFPVPQGLQGGVGADLTEVVEASGDRAAEEPHRLVRG